MKEAVQATLGLALLPASLVCGFFSLWHQVYCEDADAQLEATCQRGDPFSLLAVLLFLGFIGWALVQVFGKKKG